MHTPDSVESLLGRLMPSALSVEGQAEIEAMLDELAGPRVDVIPMKPWFRHPWGVGIAAAGIASACVLPFVALRSASPVAAWNKKAPPGFVLVGESGSINSISEEGWSEDSDGSAMRTLRLSVVEENQLLDEESGIVMLVSEPRDEYLLMPVNAF